MLFTQATEAGIALENGLLLTDEQHSKAVIPANCDRIKEWARDNHVNISISPEVKSDTGFNCTIGIMQDERVSDSTYQANKKMLKHLGDELVKFIDDMPDSLEEANKTAEDRKRLDILTNDFEAAVKAICGQDVIVHVEVFKLREINVDELAHMLKMAISEAGES